MKIAYVVIHLEKTYMQGGVGRKINMQMRLWEEMGHTPHLFLHTPDAQTLPNTTAFSFRPATTYFPFKNISKEFSRISALSQLMQSLKNFSPEVIFFRYGLYAMPLEKLHQIAPLTVELNTDDVNEYAHRGQFYYWLNRLTRPLLLKNAAALLPVSHEIARLPENRQYRKKTLVVSNGIEIDRFNPIPAPNNPQPVIGFVGSPGRSWHGVDKLYELARHLSEIQFEIIGYNASHINRPALPNMRFHGFVNQTQARAILSHADITLGSLAQHRNNMNEASPLKVREAMAYGIPTVIPYFDTDLSNHNFDFILQIPNTPNNVITHAEMIKEFAYKMQGQRVNREQVIPLIDQRKKEEERLAFFESLVESERG